MTSIAGYNLNAAPCCGAHFRSLQYRSINFMAEEHWTDGYRHRTLMPNDHGLRRCQCGAFFLMNELKDLGETEDTETPFADKVKPEDLPHAIDKARSLAIEHAARLTYWQELNHPYRELYRAHRAAEEAATQAAWLAQNAERRSWWKKLLPKKAATYVRPDDSPFTYPPFVLSDAQRDNLQALLRMHEHEEHRLDGVICAELHRELGQFDQANEAIKELKQDDANQSRRLIADLIQQRETAPMRFKM